jgi:curli biogenesis system outer membrane secretion channel CsgG
MVAKSLKSHKDLEVIRTSSEYFRTRSQVSSKNILLVKGKVTNYNRGCKYCEWLLRRNDKGKSSITVRINLIDKNTGEIIADQSIEGRAKKPGYGESRYIRVRDEIVSLVIKAKKRNS